MWNKLLSLLGVKTQAQLDAELEEARRLRNKRRMSVAHDYLDGNDNWKR